MLGVSSSFVAVLVLTYLFVYLPLKRAIHVAQDGLEGLTIRLETERNYLRGLILDAQKRAEEARVELIEDYVDRSGDAAWAALEAFAAGAEGSAPLSLTYALWSALRDGVSRDDRKELEARTVQPKSLFDAMRESEGKGDTRAMAAALRDKPRRWEVPRDLFDLLVAKGRAPARG